MVSLAIAAGGVQAINYFVANNYVKALESVASAPNQKVILMPLEASSFLGSLSGIAEIAKEAFGASPRRTRGVGAAAFLKLVRVREKSVNPARWNMSFRFSASGCGSWQPAYCCWSN